MILEEIGMRETFSATSILDYKEKFKTITERILKGDTIFYNRMELFDKLHSPTKIPDYAQSMMWIYKNSQHIKQSSRKRFEIGETPDSHVAMPELPDSVTNPQ
jgi:hypothetical protein